MAKTVLHHILEQHPAGLDQQIERNGQADITEKAFDAKWWLEPW
ncbi:hypothetical protein [Hymenobacter sp. BRD67]|nr:hypothetical protein [Hymenobacter sp. BRD67]